VYEVPAFLQQPIFVLPSLAYYDYQGVKRSTKGEQQQAKEVSIAPGFDRLGNNFRYWAVFVQCGIESR